MDNSIATAATTTSSSSSSFSSSASIFLFLPFPVPLSPPPPSSFPFPSSSLQITTEFIGVLTCNGYVVFDGVRATNQWLHYRKMTLTQKPLP